MPASLPAPRSVAEAAETFVLSRRAGAMISLRDGVRECRRLRPDCEHTDDELAEIVAALAIRHRRNLAFDRHRAGRWAAQGAAQARRALEAGEGRPA